MTYKFKIPTTLAGLNEYTKACRGNKYSGATLKRKEELKVLCACRKLWGLKLQRVHVQFSWIEPNKKRDPDNIAFAKKFILDALQQKEVIAGDGWKCIAGFTDSFVVDKENAGVEVVLGVIEDA